MGHTDSDSFNFQKSKRLYFGINIEKEILMGDQLSGLLNCHIRKKTKVRECVYFRTTCNTVTDAR